MPGPSRQTSRAVTLRLTGAESIVTSLKFRISNPSHSYGLAATAVFFTGLCLYLCASFIHMKVQVMLLRSSSYDSRAERSIGQSVVGEL